MGLLQKLKSALGLDEAESTSAAGSSGDVDVTVEREPSTESEDAVKGTETATTERESDVGAAESDETAADIDATVPEAEPDATDDADEEPEPAVPEGSDDPVTEIKGIGPAYAKRLSGLDIETVGELAAADAAEIASETDLSESRVEGWIERARAY
ncbi:helix-hairpin-helix domain-containing protein [Haloarcula sp. JP-L23]|uniref:helix-hairpin-helix domain-containing protein n=1 Tax=Haloarcula sp. JP-L23 TaxID=2716717 RepID=UPI00140EC968|nr:hypothetical protein G9465_08735 [Haloarcula sp. JP-L23]